MKGKIKNKAWFRKIRGSYLPVSWQGLAVYFVYLIYLCAVPVVWFLNGHDVWKLLSGVVPLAVGAAILTQFIASKNSR